MSITDRIYARYLVETSDDIMQAVAVMAGEQSSGTFISVPGETDSLKLRAGARVERVSLLGDFSSPSLPGARPGPAYHRGEVELSWPLENCGVSLPNLVTTIAGNLFELKQFAGLRILDVNLPSPFANKYPGPQFGIDGTRQLAGVLKGPLVGTIIKPSVGLSPDETALLVKILVVGGVDFIKDDELQSDGNHCPFEMRVRAVMGVVNRAADKLGKKVMVAFNVTGDLDEMRRRHDLVAALGGTCIMASLNSIGFVGVIELRRHSRLPIHAHRNGCGVCLGTHCSDGHIALGRSCGGSLAQIICT